MRSVEESTTPAAGAAFPVSGVAVVGV